MNSLVAAATEQYEQKNCVNSKRFIVSSSLSKQNESEEKKLAALTQSQHTSPAKQ